MKDLAALAEKYSTRRRYVCRVCSLPEKQLAVFRALRADHGMSIRGLVRVLEGEFGLKIGDTSVQKHFAQHEPAGRA